MMKTASRHYDAGIRKAAILVASLEQEASDRLLDQLGPDCAALVLEAVLALDEIDPDEQRRIIAEFRRIGPMVPDKSPAGIELNDPTVEHRYLSAPRRDEIIDSFEVSEACCRQNAGRMSARPFGFLHQAEQERLLQLLATERPQTVALVLSHLPPHQAGDVLSHFAPPLQVEVVRRLVDLEETDPETLRRVEAALESRLSQQSARERTRLASPDAAARILAACDNEVAGSILDNLAAYDRPLAQRFGRKPLQFDDLAEFDDAALSATVQEADALVVQAALLGAPSCLVQRVLGVLDPDEAQGLSRKLDYPGPIRLSDIEEARRRMVLAAERILYGNPRKSAMAA